MTEFLVDKSVLARAHIPQVTRHLRLLSEADAIITCPVIDLEVLYSARSKADYDALVDERRGFRSVPLTQAIATDALAIQGALAVVGRHRTPIPDLLIAASARAAGAAVLHYDADFEAIASVTELDQHWVSERGSL